MTKDEALKLVQDALVALENISTALREDDVLGSDIELMLNTIAAIHKALAQPVQVTSGWSLRYVYFDENGIPLMHREPEERNFCPRCGKRTADPTTIHTCTPPQENT